MSKKDLADNVSEAVEAARPLPPAAQRALAEAEERRRLREANGRPDAPNVSQPAELGGRQGPDPVRYGDWENSGIVSDF